jgi:uncharacterized membrane protein
VLSGKTRLDEETIASGELQWSMLFGAACAMPVLLALWYAPALVVFHDCGPWRAVRLSFRAALANWRALSVYGVMVVLYGFVVPGLVMGLVTLMLPAPAAVAIGVIALMPYLFLFVATLHISDYVSYRDIFHAAEKAAAQPAPASA